MRAGWWRGLVAPAGALVAGGVALQKFFLPAPGGLIRGESARRRRRFAEIFDAAEGPGALLARWWVRVKVAGAAVAARADRAGACGSGWCGLAAPFPRGLLGLWCPICPMRK